MSRYTQQLQESFRRIDGEETAVIRVPHNRELTRVRLTTRQVGVLAATAAAVAGIAAGMISTPQEAANNKIPSTTQLDTESPQQNSGINEPSHATDAPNVSFGPTDFALEFHKFSTSDGCMSFGKIVIDDQELTAQIGAQPYAIEIDSATTEFYTCMNDAKVSIYNGELNTKENAYPEVVALDATSLTYDAVLSDVEMSMRPITPKEQLQEEGTEDKACAIFDVCSIKATDTSPLPKEVTDVVLASAKAQVVTSAQDAFAKIEHKAMTLYMLNDLYTQADELHVNRDLVQFMYVNKDGKIVDAVPNYPSSLLKTTLKAENAAITKNDLKRIFGDTSIAMQYIPNKEARR